ncbi:MAG TPA: ABC transporter substrate-binding protein [Candidatus Elarobacter sp.]|jgi:branched-chain amino acid transport system substrate-binding protein|nr:ABC transporter substrate-binding protein [Candidatus Elarobacter sp.]
MRRTIVAAACMVTLVAGAGASPISAATDPIKIAAILSTSGPSAPLGVPESNAVKLAEREVNAHGGINGRPIQIDVVDDGAKADVAAQLATQMLASGHVAIFCGTRTDTSAAVARVTGAGNVLQTYTTPTEALWRSPRGIAKNVFEVNPRDQLEAIALLTFAKNHLHAKAVAVLHDENLYGSGGATIAEAEAKTLGIQVVGDESYPGTATDFTAQIVKLRDAKPDAVVLWGATTTPGLAIKAARTLGLTVPILGSSGILSPAILNVAGGAAAGEVYSASPLAGAPSAEQRAFAALYDKEYHQPVVSFAANGWDAVQLIVTALRGAKGKTDGASLEAALESGMPIPLVDGTYKFSATDHNGLVPADVHIAKAVNGTWGAP